MSCSGFSRSYPLRADSAVPLSGGHSGHAQTPYMRLCVAPIAQDDLIPFLTIIFVSTAHAHCTFTLNIRLHKHITETKDIKFIKETKEELMAWEKKSWRTRCDSDSDSDSDIAGPTLTCASPLYDATLQISVTVIFYAVQQ
jgi:hypothetical protein